MFKKRFNIPTYLFCFLIVFILFSFVSIQFSNKVKADETVSLYPVADAEVYSGTPNTNYGSYNIIEVGHSTLNGFDRYSFVRFDISGIPSNAIITSSWLSVFSKQCDGDPISVTVKQVTNDWSESTITWKSAPSSTDIDSALTVVTCDYDIYGFDVTGITQNWIDGQSNYGLYMVYDSSESFLKTFYSRENGDINREPVLDVIYTVPSSEQPTQDNPSTNDTNETNPNNQNNPSDNSTPTTDNPQSSDTSPVDNIPDDLQQLLDNPESDLSTMPIFSPLIGSFGYSFLPCLVLLCCCLLLVLLLTIVFLLVKRNSSNKKEKIQNLSKDEVNNKNEENIKN